MRGEDVPPSALVLMQWNIYLNYFTPAKSGESVGIVCKPDYDHDTTQQKACQDNGIIIIGIKKADDERVEYPCHPVRHLQY